MAKNARAGESSNQRRLLASAADSERGPQLVNDANGQGRILALHVAFELAK
jgi:hypothetical protein